MFDIYCVSCSRSLRCGVLRSTFLSGYIEIPISNHVPFLCDLGAYAAVWLGVPVLLGNDSTRVDRSFLELLEMSTRRWLETSVPVIH